MPPTTSRRLLLPGLVAIVVAIVVALASTHAAAASRTHLYREVNLAMQYSFERQIVTSSALPPPSSIGLEFIHRRPGLARGERGLRGLDIRVMVADPPGPALADIYFADAWALFGIGGVRSQVRVGQFNIPFGVNPVLEPRGIFRLPLEAVDLGFKKDWGVSWQRESGEFDFEVGGFLGTGGDLHWRRGGFLFAGRLGTPTYREFEYGFSALVADTAPTMNYFRAEGPLTRRVRAGVDTIYLYGTHTIFKAEFSTGTDDGRTMLGAMGAVDWIPPRANRWVLALQTEALRRNSPTDPMDMLRITAEASYSLGNLTTLRVDLVRVLDSPQGASTDLFFQIHNYGR